MVGRRLRAGRRVEMNDQELLKEAELLIDDRMTDFHAGHAMSNGEFYLKKDDDYFNFMMEIKIGMRKLAEKLGEKNDH